MTVAYPDPSLADVLRAWIEIIKPDPGNEIPLGKCIGKLGQWRCVRLAGWLKCELHNAARSWHVSADRSTGAGQADLDQRAGGRDFPDHDALGGLGPGGEIEREPPGGVVSAGFLSIEWTVSQQQAGQAEWHQKLHQEDPYK